ncbi:MAG TPA: malonic semialdehyde reductase [Steroidobacteraceae bacterium]|nr:malonic semialdehyde reductase [Steroidobacteraceae bacterium]
MASADRINELRSRLSRLDEHSLDLLFRVAHTHNGWLDRPVTDETLRTLYDLFKLGPTSLNTCPARFVFVRSPEAKERLRPALSPGNVDKTMAAPVTAIIGYDEQFYEHMGFLFPGREGVRERFAANPANAHETAFRNGTLQGAYLIIAARAIGLDAGPMSGFDNARVDAEFFAGTRCKSNFLCNLGYGDPAKVRERLPRFAFETVCQVL